MKVRVTRFPVGVPALNKPPFVQIEWRRDDEPAGIVELPVDVYDQIRRAEHEERDF